MHQVLLSLGCLLAVLLAIGASQAADPIDYDGCCIPKGVHRWNAPYKVGNGTMQIGQAARTRRAGPPELMHQEQAYVHD